MSFDKNPARRQNTSSTLKPSKARSKSRLSFSISPLIQNSSYADSPSSQREEKQPKSENIKKERKKPENGKNAEKYEKFEKSWGNKKNSEKKAGKMDENFSAKKSQAGETSKRQGISHPPYNPHRNTFAKDHPGTFEGDSYSRGGNFAPHNSSRPLSRFSQYRKEHSSNPSRAFGRARENSRFEKPAKRFAWDQENAQTGDSHRESANKNVYGGGNSKYGQRGGDQQTPSFGRRFNGLKPDWKSKGAAKNDGWTKYNATSKKESVSYGVPPDEREATRRNRSSSVQETGRGESNQSRAKMRTFERYSAKRKPTHYYDGEESRYSDKESGSASREGVSKKTPDVVLDSKQVPDKEEMLTYKDFLLRQKDDITPEEAQKLYEQYKKEYHLSNTKIFFNRHKDEEWFREKYSPSIRLEVFKRHLKLSEDASKEFFSEMNRIKDETGKTDREKKLNEFIAKHELKRDLDAFELIEKLDDEIDIEDEEEKVREIENRLYDERHKGGEFSDSDSDFDDQNLQSARREDGEVSEKGNGEVGIEEEGSTKNSTFSSSFGKNLSDLGKNIAKKTQKRFKEGEIECDENSVFISTIPLKVTRQHLEEVFEKIDGFRKICVSEPIPKYNMNRFAWVTFDSQDSCREALKLNGVKINYSNEYPPLYLHVLPKKKSSKCVRPAHFYTLFRKRVDLDIEQALKVIETLNERKIFDEKFDEEILELFEPKLVKLNLLITYLRIAHSFCYYCGIDYMTEEGLMSRCTKHHPRNTIIKTERETNFRYHSGRNSDNDEISDFKKWTLQLDKKINEFFEKDTSKEILNWSDRKAMEIMKANTKHISKGRCECNICSKMFMAEEFVIKHISIKHAVQLDKMVKDSEVDDFFRNYEVDSNRFLLENVESVIPGDVSSFAQKNPKAAYYQNSIQTSGFGNSIFPKANAISTGAFKGYSKSKYYPLKSQGEFNRRNMYNDLDKPPGDGEEDIDYGFATETLPMFHL